MCRARSEDSPLQNWRHRLQRRCKLQCLYQPRLTCSSQAHRIQAVKRTARTPFLSRSQLRRARPHNRPNTHRPRLRCHCNAEQCRLTPRSLQPHRSIAMFCQPAARLVQSHRSKAMVRQLDMFTEARDLFRNQLPTGDLASIVERALARLIAERKKQRFAQTNRPRSERLSGSDTTAERTGANTPPVLRAQNQPAHPNVQHVARSSEAPAGRPGATAPVVRAEQQLPRPDGRHISHASSEAHANDARATLAVCAESQPAKKLSTRHIAYSLRRQVYARDEGRCCFVTADGTRCRARGNLEFHHIVPFACGGEATLENICLMCRSHNALLAERDYGRSIVKRRIADQTAGTQRARVQERGRSCDGTQRCEKTTASVSRTPVSTRTIVLGPEPG
jgi:hypothetical protein